MIQSRWYAPRRTVEQVEEGVELAPKFDENGLIPVVTTDHASGELLMHGYMNEEALRETIRRGEAVYFSRSRQTLWHKGATSGLVQKVVELRIDDDQDAVWLRVDLPDAPMELTFQEHEKVFDPKQVYGDAPNPTKL